MTDPANMLEVLDRIEADCALLRRMIRGDAESAPVSSLDGDADDDFAPCNLLETSEAATRFNLPMDTVRRWCREGCGVKHGGRNGGRHLASIPKFRRRMRL